MNISVDTFAQFVRHQDTDTMDLLWYRYAVYIQNQRVPV